MCKYCTDEVKFDSASCNVYIEKDILFVDYNDIYEESNFSDDIRINYCPMCGNRLREEVINAEDTTDDN